MNRELAAALEMLNKPFDVSKTERIAIQNVPWEWKTMKSFPADVQSENVCPGRTYLTNLHGEQHLVRIVATVSRKRFIFKVIE